MGPILGAQGYRCTSIRRWPLGCNQLPLLFFVSAVVTYDPADAPSQIALVHPNIVHSAAGSSLTCPSQAMSLRAYGAAELVACRLMKHCAAISSASLMFSLSAPVCIPNADPSRATARGACSDECCGSQAHN